MVIILLRHAKAIQTAGDIPDFDRPLRPKGIKQCAALAEAIPDVLKFTQGIRPGIWCSPALRTRQTLSHGLPWTQNKPSDSNEDLTLFPEWLYLADSSRFQRELLAYEDTKPLIIIGHNNGLSDLAGELTGGLCAPLGTCHFIVLRQIDSRLSGKFQMDYRWEPPKFID